MKTGTFVKLIIFSLILSVIWVLFIGILFKGWSVLVLSMLGPFINAGIIVFLIRKKYPKEERIKFFKSLLIFYILLFVALFLIIKIGAPKYGWVDEPFRFIK